MAVDIAICEFEERYGDALRSMIIKIQRDEFGIDISLDDQPDLSGINGFYCKGKGGFWVATIDGDVAGSVALIDIGNDQVALRKMFVKEEYRGKKFGVAQQLLDFVFAYASDADIAEILLGTTDKFLAAHRFYEKNNFKLIDVENLPESFPRMDVDTRFYVKAVA